MLELLKTVTSGIKSQDEGALPEWIQHCDFTVLLLACKVLCLLYRRKQTTFLTGKCKKTERNLFFPAWEKSKHKFGMEFIRNIILIFIICIQKKKRRNLVSSTWKWFAPSLLTLCCTPATTTALDSQRITLSS